jgi:hypothetical protein
MADVLLALGHWAATPHYGTQPRATSLSHSLAGGSTQPTQATTQRENGCAALLAQVAFLTISSIWQRGSANGVNHAHPRSAQGEERASSNL